MNLENTIIKSIVGYRDYGSIEIKFENDNKTYDLVLLDELYQPTNIKIYKDNCNFDVLSWEDALKVLKTFKMPSNIYEYEKKRFDELIERITKKIEIEKFYYTAD